MARKADGTCDVPPSEALFNGVSFYQLCQSAVSMEHLAADEGEDPLLNLKILDPSEVVNHLHRLRRVGADRGGVSFKHRPAREAD
jgi:hypothetical protein